MADFLPNSYQTPNIYVDELMHLLTDQEWKVVSYALRRIYGFNKRQDRISLSQFESGTRAYDGRVLDHGTGLGRVAIVAALKALVDFGILIKVDAPNDGKSSQAGQCYALQTDASKVNRAGLEARLAAKQAANQQRTKAAANRRRQRAGGTSDEPLGGTSHEPLGGTSHEPLGGTSHEPLGGTSDVPTINRGKPEGKPEQQQQLTPSPGADVVVVVSPSESSWNTPTYRALRYRKVGAAKEFAHEPLDLIRAYLDRVGPDHHPAQITEDLRAGLHRATPEPAAPPAPAADDPARPAWISADSWLGLTDAQRDLLQGAQLRDGRIEAQRETWTKTIYERWWPMAERLVAAAQEQIAV